MKNKNKSNLRKSIKIVSLAMAMWLFSTFFMACTKIDTGLDDDDVQIAEGKTGVIVGVYDGALGYDFAKQLERMYEAENPNVDIVIRHKKNEYDDGQLVNKIKYNDEDMYFLSANVLNLYTSAGLLADITDTVTEKIYDNNGNFATEGATKSIEDTLWSQWRDIYKDSNNKYYAIPNFTPVTGIWYDADLFKQKCYEVPTTYQDFKSLMNDMVLDGIIPISVASGYQYILDGSLTAFHANYEGKDNFLLNTTFNGTDSNLGEINISNAYKLSNQEGKRAALQFCYDIATVDSYTSQQTKNGQTHLNSQDNYVFSVESSQGRIAMILENSFWEREVKATIDEMGSYEPDYGWGKRNFKYMVAPVDKTLERQTIYLGYSNSFVCLSSNSKRLTEAKKFLQFAQSRKALVTYTQYTSTLRPYDYDFTEAEYNACTPMTRSQIDLKRNDKVDFVTVGAVNNVSKRIADFGTSWLYNIGTTNNPFTVFRNSKKTVDDYIAESLAKNKTYFN